MVLIYDAGRVDGTGDGFQLLALLLLLPRHVMLRRFVCIDIVKVDGCSKCFEGAVELPRRWRCQ